MSDFLPKLKKVIKKAESEISSYLKSEVIQNKFVGIVEDSFYSNVISCYKKNLTKNNIDEFKITRTSLQNIKKEFESLFKKCKQTLKTGKNKAKIDFEVYQSFRKKLKDIDKNSYKLLIALEKEIDINSCKKNINEFKRKAPKLSKKASNLDDRIHTILYECIIKSNKNISGRRLTNVISKTIENSIPKIGDGIFNILIKNSPKMLKQRRKLIKEFEVGLLKIWKKPIDLLEMFLVVNYESGEEFIIEHGKEASENNDYLFESMTRMQAKACRVFWEILVLLKSGFPDGALSRWRTLYETTVLCCFINEHGQSLAKRFIDHNVVEAYYDTMEYQKHCGKLGYTPLTKKEFKEIEKHHYEVCREYEKGFKKRYGWIPTKILKDRTFKGIEDSLDFHKYRPFYKIACSDIHTVAKGLYNNLGLIFDGTSEDSILAGPSGYGLADPAQNAAICLNIITSLLLTTKPTMNRMITVKAMNNLVNDICKTFCEVQLEIEKDEKAYIKEMRKWAKNRNV